MRKHNPTGLITDADKRIWLMLVLVSMAGMYDIPGAAVIPFPGWLQWSGVTAVAIMKSSLITAALILVRGKRWTGLMVKLLTAFYCVLCVANGLTYFFYGFGISNKMMIILSQTSKREVLEFLPGVGSNLLSTVSSGWFWVVALLIVTIIYVQRFLPGKTFAIAAICISTSGLGFAAFYIAEMKNGRTGMSVFLRTSKAIIQARRENRHLEDLLSRLRPFPNPEAVVNNADSFNLVLVIGESASRGHLSAYGYPVSTTPRMEALGDSLVLFSDAIASSTSTAGNLERILGFKPDNDTVRSWADYPLMIDLFNAAGYKTYWLSNQERAGIWGNASGAMAGNASVVEYMSSESGDDALLIKHDEVLLPEIRKAMSDSSRHKLICVHLMGSHMLYSSRYPRDSRRHIKGRDIVRTMPRKWLDGEKADVIADYDNSILYTDSILGEIMDYAGDAVFPTMVVYFSDHGENVYDDRDFIGRDEKSVEVPFMVYANKSYHERRPEIIQRLREGRDLAFSTSNVIHMLMNVSGIGYPLYDSTLDFLSPDFVEKDRFVDDRVWRYGERNQEKR